MQEWDERIFRRNVRISWRALPPRVSVWAPCRRDRCICELPWPFVEFMVDRVYRLDRQGWLVTMQTLYIKIGGAGAEKGPARLTTNTGSKGRFTPPMPCTERLNLSAASRLCKAAASPAMSASSPASEMVRTAILARRFRRNRSQERGFGTPRATTTDRRRTGPACGLRARSRPSDRSVSCLSAGTAIRVGALFLPPRRCNCFLRRLPLARQLHICRASAQRFLQRDHRIAERVAHGFVRRRPDRVKLIVRQVEAAKVRDRLRRQAHQLLPQDDQRRLDDVFDFALFEHFSWIRRSFVSAISFASCCPLSFSRSSSVRGSSEPFAPT